MYVHIAKADTITMSYTEFFINLIKILTFLSPSIEVPKQILCQSVSTFMFYILCNK